MTNLREVREALIHCHAALVISEATLVDVKDADPEVKLLLALAKRDVEEAIEYLRAKLQQGVPT